MSPVWIFVSMIVVQLLLFIYLRNLALILDASLALTLLILIYRRLGKLARGDLRRNLNEQQKRREQQLLHEAEAAAKANETDESDLPSKKDIIELAADKNED